MAKQIIALLVSSIFAFSLGVAYAEDQDLMPWQRAAQTSPKKADKARTKDIKANKKAVGKAKAEKAQKTHIAKAQTNVEKTKKTNTEKVEHTSTAKEDKKETGQKKKSLFW